ncbi:heterokaryon incompatibility protein-domain-containing protein [Bisporella sp. PMI_857]|nr:heterokaryon incompatibility protein-domain-containing protein [Bisporella sp. PMI_857]
MKTECDGRAKCAIAEEGVLMDWEAGRRSLFTFENGSIVAIIVALGKQAGGFYDQIWQKGILQAHMGDGEGELHSGLAENGGARSRRRIVYCRDRRGYTREEIYVELGNCGDAIRARFNRFHKYTGDNLTQLNEFGEWETGDSDDSDEEHLGHEIEDKPIWRRDENEDDEVEAEESVRDMCNGVQVEEGNTLCAYDDMSISSSSSDLFISNNLGASDDKRHSYVPFHKEPKDWIAAANSGCTVCSNLVDEMKAASPTFDQLMQNGIDKLLRKKLRYYPWRTINMHVMTSEVPSPEGGIEFDAALTINLYLGGKMYFALLQLREISPMLVSKIEPSTGSRSSLLLAKSWIERCQNEHSECSAVTPNVKAPTRLLELSGDHVRLRSAQELEITPAYATLSHCWGALKILQLKQDTLLSFKNTIPIDGLCKTFQDAIITTQTLGLKYLWIDSLCIIQDSPSDWSAESSQMAHVYGNSTVNLAATHASDGSHGLFVSRPISVVSRRYATTNTGKTYELSNCDSNAAQPLETYKRCLTKAPLTKRAWVFQERYLAPRTLHFTNEQIFFECRHSTTCETWQCGSRSFLHFEIDFPRQIDFKAWPRIVEHYTQGQLSFQKDKFVAISGVARQFAAKSENEYIAGLWKTMLERALCWMVVRSWDNEIVKEVEEKERKVCIAPGWSWASTSCPIRYNLWHFAGVRASLDREYDKVMKVIDVDVQYLGTDLFGQVQDATLTFRCGPMISASVMDALTESYDFNENGHGFSEKSYTVLNEDKYFSIQGYGRIVYDQGKTNNFDNKYFLPIIRDVRSNRANQKVKEVDAITGLIVTAAQGKAKGWFERIGAWDIIFNVSYKDMMGMMERDAGLMGEDMYGEVLERSENGIKQYAGILDSGHIITQSRHTTANVLYINADTPPKAVTYYHTAGI